MKTILITYCVFALINLVMCQNEGDLRLQHGPNAYSGQVQIYHESQWGVICDDVWGIQQARVACRQLGFRGAVSFQIRSFYSSATMIFWLDGIRCSGTELRIEDCNNSPYGSHNCSPTEHSGVVCDMMESGELNLVNGVDGESGTLRIYHGNRWGSICRHNFGTEEAMVACRQLRLPSQSATFWFNDVLGDFSNFWLDDIICNGTEQRLDNCAHGNWGSHNCRLTDVINLRCGYMVPLLHEADISLSPRISNASGEILVLHNNRPGYVCFDNFTYWDATVICRQLNMSSDNPTWTAVTAPDNNPIHVDEFKCTGIEDSFMGCFFDDWGSPGCRRDRIVSLSCNPPMDGDVKLVNGPGPWAGRLMLYHMNSWGAVCDDNFGRDEATVVCRQLGFDTDYARAICCSSSLYRGSNDNSLMIIADNLQCGGDEKKLVDCTHVESDRADCGRDEFVSVVCRIKYGTLRLQDGPGPNSGRLEIYHRLRWGGICMPNFDGTDAVVACTQLGYMPANAIVAPYTATIYGHLASSSFIWLRDVACNGGEKQLAYCHHAAWGSGSCPRDQYVALHCRLPQPGDIRVTSGPGRWQGKLQYFDGNSWGAVCGSNFNTNEAHVACRQLGFPSSGAQRGCCSRLQFGGEDDTELISRSFDCRGNETVLTDCRVTPLPVSCDMNDKVDITCYHDPCMSSPCFHGSTCTAIPPSSRFRCNCTPGWTGPLCRTQILITP